jgi:hypothetical protein
MKWLFLLLLATVFIAGCVENESQNDENIINITVEALSGNITPGEYIDYDITIVLLTKSSGRDVTVDYNVASDSGYLIYENSEIVAVDSSLMLNRKLLIPSNTKPGIYTIEVKAVYENSQASSKTSFIVV